MNVQSRLRELLNERGWTEYELAKRANMHQSTISNLFVRNNLPTLPTLEAMCSGFGITMAQFFSEGDDPVVLTAEQWKILAAWSTISEDQKRIVLEVIGSMK